MNRAERRKAESAERRDRRRRRWVSHITHFESVAQGAVENYVIHTADIEALHFTAASGDPIADMLARSLDMWRQEATKVEAMPGAVFLCLDCPQEFGPNTATPAAFTITVPFANQDCAIVTGICATCAGRGEDLQVMALRHLKRLWPGLFLMEGGRA